MTVREKWFHRAANFALGLALFFVLFVQSPGEESHDALCAFKKDLQGRYDNSVRYLNMTLDERIEEFGPQLGTIPEETIRTSANNQKDTLDSLKPLDC
jgi:hypothetical protein